MQAENVRNLIGKGMKFPFEPTIGKGVQESEYMNRINQSLFILLETHKGSRLLLPDFGTDIYKYRFEPYDEILIERIRYTLTEDIKRWEPRITLNSITFKDTPEDIDNHILYVNINYTIITTGVPGNYVYPFRRDIYSLVEE